ncbi:hypothetical protein B0O99DRAFT_144449 [Bisporella sp. PMI_857]|nr:hypothetical protein B0O99DRAFT_144449 [Bisporella sp. PMI_857]
MAEVLGVVAGSAQIVGHLLGSIQTIRKFMRDVRNAPKDLVAILDDLNRLSTVFEALGELESDIAWTLLKNSLNHCQAASSTLQRFANTSIKSLNGYPHQGTYRSIKLVFKKDEMEYLKGQLEQANKNLQLAISASLLYVVSTEEEQFKSLKLQKQAGYIFT